MLKVLMRNIMVGDTLPEITLPVYMDKTIQNLKITELFPETPYILLGHPGAFTILSTKSQIPDYMSSKLPIPVVLWSVNDPFLIRRYAQKYEITLPIICDFNGELTRTFDLGLPEEEYFSFCCRRTLCIVKNSKILSVSSELNVQYTKATKPEMANHLISVLI